MALKLKPEGNKGTRKLSVSFPLDLAEQLEAYRELLQSSSTNYVVVEAVRSFLVSDKQFQRAYEERRRKGGAPGAGAAGGPAASRAEA